MRPALVILMAIWLGLAAAAAQELSGLARLDAGASSVRDAGQGVEITLEISQAVPWRVRLLDAPPRLVMDFREVDWRGIGEIARDTGRIGEVRAGSLRPGWSRLVMELSGPMVVDEAGMQTGAGAARVTLRLVPSSQEDFAKAATVPEPPEWAMPVLAELPEARPEDTGPLVVVLDPGHGGIDPGAEREGVSEADLMLTFARELKEALIRAGGMTVVLTRSEDVFVPLETRITIAREAGADVFLSLHADALSEGEAVGATIYTLAEDASDEAAATLAERHDRDDLLAGVDLSDQDDLVAEVLMDMARTETAPRTDLLAKALAGAIKGEGLKMHRIPLQFARFSVLKAPDIPSALIELGFLSSKRDLARLTDPAWRAQLAKALVTGLQVWAREDAAQAQVKRE